MSKSMVEKLDELIYKLENDKEFKEQFMKEYEEFKKENHKREQEEVNGQKKQ